MGASLEARRAMMRAAHEAVRVVGDDLLGKAQRDAPVETGALRGSGHAEVTVSGLQAPRDGSHADAVVSFDTPYAARQHEELRWEHPKGGRAKYLERHVKEMAQRYERAIGEKVAQALRSHG